MIFFSKMKWPLLLLAFIINQTAGHVAADYRLGRSHILHENNEKDRSAHQTAHSSSSSKHHGPFTGNCKNGKECVPFVSCPGHIWNENKIFCKTFVAKKGVCCDTGKNITKPFTRKDRSHHEKHQQLDSATIGILTHKSRAAMAQIRAKEAKLLMSDNSIILTPGSASYSHFRNSRRFNHLDLTEVFNDANRALEIAMATSAFKERDGISNIELEQGMIQDDLRPTSLGYTCTPHPICPAAVEKYRRIDGSCNNHYNSLWGATRTPLARLMPPLYEDGIWLPRFSVVRREPLPSARYVTMSVFNEKDDATNEEFTLLLMQFGQFLSHDIAQGLDFTYGNGSAISCCSKDGKKSLPIDSRHFACMPIYLPKTDTFYGGYDQECMNFVRTVLAPREDCTLGYSQQMNKVTHFIDGSTIYGSSSEQTGELRSFEGGKLKFFDDYGRHLLPLAKDKDACLTREEGTACFESGDTRTNQMITLVALHTLFMREHNRIADELASMNPEWDDEELFLEARQIVIAELQVITYKEFLPAIIGDVTMEEFDLNLEEGYEYDFGYDPKVNPSILNEFSTAAFRFGHSIVSGDLKMYGLHKMEQMISIPEVMFYPSQMRRSKFLDMILNTLTTEPIQAVDGSFSEALTRYLFRAGNPFGVDLPSINIQRGRDHGLRSYNDYRELSGLPKYKSFKDFGPEFGEKLRKVYSSVDDVDLWVGGLLEKSTEGSLVGPLFRDIIAEQFLRLKRGDRYFFENDPSSNPGYFTPDQLYQLRKASMSRIICDNNDHILLSHQAPSSFRKPGISGNQFVDCHSDIIPRINLKYWEY